MTTINENIVEKPLPERANDDANLVNLPGAKQYKCLMRDHNHYYIMELIETQQPQKQIKNQEQYYCEDKQQ